MLTVRDLVKPTLERTNRNHETYKNLYDECAAHIQRANGAGGRETTWMVPPFVIGRPPFTHSHAMNYVSEKLRRGGFTVTTMPGCDGRIHVTWERASIETARKIRERIAQTSRMAKARTKPKPDAETKTVPLAVTLERLRNSTKAAFKLK
jgi:hypothetical protein